MKIFSKAFIVLMVANTCISCHCEDVTCPALSAEYASWLNSNEGDTARFINGSGATMVFPITKKQVSASYNMPCSSSSLGCICHDCNPANGLFYGATTDTSRRLIDSTGRVWRIFNGLSTSVSGQYGSPIEYKILDHTNNIDIDSLGIVFSSATDTLLPSYTVGTRTYNNVIVHHTDTTVVPYPYTNTPHLHYTFFVITSWYSKEYGVIAFYDLQTQSLFYRE